VTLTLTHYHSYFALAQSGLFPSTDARR